MQTETLATLHSAVELKIREHGIGTPTISDVLDALGIRECVLDSRLGFLNSAPTTVVHGAAYPVRWHPVRKGPAITAPGPSTWEEVRNFIVPELTDGRGQVYIAGSGPLMTDAAMLGGMSTTYLSRNLRFEAIVLGGAIRDRKIVQHVPTAVVGSGFIPIDSQGAFEAVSDVDHCIINGVVVHRGDWVISDGDGTVIIPRARLDEVLEKCAEIEKTEENMLGQIRDGAYLPELIDTIGRI